MVWEFSIELMPSLLESELATRVPLREDADGVIRIGATRVTLDSLVKAFDEGGTAEEIVQQYPALELADVYAVIGYYLRHRELVNRYLKTKETEAARIKQENQKRFSPQSIRERLLARRNTKA